MLVLMFGGLGLIGLGGCFTIGILITLYPGVATGPNIAQAPWTSGDYFFCGVLYFLAFACLAGGTTLIALATRAATRHLQ